MRLKIFLTAILFTCSLCSCAADTGLQPTDTAAENANISATADTSSNSTEQTAAYDTADNNSDQPADTNNKGASMNITQLIGTVTEIKDNQILLDGGDDSSPYDDTLINIIGSEDAESDTAAATMIYSWPGSAAQDTLLHEKKLEDIQPGDTLYAYVSSNMTRSIPPMANAFLILCDVGQDGSAPACGTITEISTDDSGNLNFYLDCDLVLIPGPEVIIRSLPNAELPAASADNDGAVTAEAVTGVNDADESTSETPADALSISNLKVGDTVLVSYRFMTMNIPAMTNPETIWILQ